MRDVLAVFAERERRASERCSYAYTLSYPACMGGSVFYVGKGTGNRINRHEDEARRGVQSPKCDAIRQIWDAGEEVAKEKVRENLTNQEALDLESDLIRHYGIENLTNIPLASASPKEESVIPASICLYKDFRMEIEELIKQHMQQEGIELSVHACHKYLQEICMHAIRAYISQ